MKILVINLGSSSIKCQYFVGKRSVASLLVERIGEKESYSNIRYREKNVHHTAPVSDHLQALKHLFTLLTESAVLSSIAELDAIGHRVVHGGAEFSAPTLVTEKVIESIRSLIPLAPLHNPANLKGIEVIRKLALNLPQVAVFDTAFHQTMPKKAALYPLPYALYENDGIRRYGFHGTSHAYVAKEAAEMMGQSLHTVNLITLHLGNGASATAIKAGKSIDTSMGFTPLEGLMMGTRSGDIDPAIIPFLSENHKMPIDAIEKMLNKESGLKGICGSNDMREVIGRSEEGDKRAALALEMYVQRIKKYIGAYTVILGRVDAIVFTGGIGEHAEKVREMVCENMHRSIGLKIDLIKNKTSSETSHAIHDKESKMKVLVIPTNEELEIALQTEEILKNNL